MSRYLNNNNVNCFNNTNCYNNVSNHYTVADGQSEILAWLSPLEPRKRHQEFRTRRVDGVGDWLLQTEEFRSWCDGASHDEADHATLFCYGNPGVGKSYTSSQVIDTLCDRARGQNIAVACLYFDFAARLEQSPVSVLGALLKQIVGGLENMPERIVKAFEEHKKVIGGRGLLLRDIVEILVTTSSSQRTFICIDALDECVPEHRLKILSSIRQIAGKSPYTRIFLTGRPQIRGEILKHLSGRVAIVSISPHKNDVIGYIRAKLDEDTTPDAMDDRLEGDILEWIPEAVSEIFLLVSLKIEATLREPTIYRRRQKLNAVTDGLGLGEAYGTTIGRIKAQGGEKLRLGIAALMWICYSERPLQAGELCHALAVEIGSPNLNPDNVPSVETLLGCCQGLITIDKESSTVRLIHFTLKEYLCAHPDLFGRAHSILAETCLTFLNSKQVKDLSADWLTDLPDTPFLRYSSLYWGNHAKLERSNSAKSLALDLLSQYNDHVSVKFLLEELVYRHGFIALFRFTGLHCASFFGISELVASLIDMEACHASHGVALGVSPLALASDNGHEGVVKLLLKREYVNPSSRDPFCDQRPLVWAIHNKHEGVVSLLLGWKGIDPAKTDKFCPTPLCRWLQEPVSQFQFLIIRNAVLGSEEVREYHMTG